MSYMCFQVASANVTPAFVLVLGTYVQAVVSFAMFNPQMAAPPENVDEDPLLRIGVLLQDTSNDKNDHKKSESHGCSSCKKSCVQTLKTLSTIYTIVSLTLIVVLDIIEANRLIHKLNAQGASVIERFKCYSYLVLYTPNIKTILVTQQIGYAFAMFQLHRNRISEPSCQQINAQWCLMNTESPLKRISFLVFIIALCVSTVGVLGGMGAFIVYIWVYAAFFVGFYIAGMIILVCCCCFCRSCCCCFFAGVESEQNDASEESNQDPFLTLIINVFIVVPAFVIADIWVARAFALFLFKEKSYIDALTFTTGGWAFQSYFVNMLQVSEMTVAKIARFVAALT